MHLIETTPAPCNVCGRGNTPDANGERPQFVDFERDINWNDPLIICEDCVAKAGGLVGMASKEMLETAKQEVREKDKELHAAQAKMDQMERTARRIGVEFAGKKKVASV